MKTLSVLFFLLITIPVFSNKYYVDSSATGANDGSSWTDAFDSLHPALAVAVNGDTVYVAEGVYKPPTDTDRTAFFRMPSGVVMMGGYPSGGGLRNLTDHRSILSGDIGVPDDPADNTYHVIMCYQTSPATVIDGFYITGGYADGSGDDGNGGGVYVKTNSSGSYGMTIIRCHIYDNYALTGGGVNINQKGEIYYSVIERNRAGAYGGGVSIRDDGRAYNTVIRNNYAVAGGGGVSIGGFNTAPGLFNCIISNNETPGNGSGILQGESRVINCDIVNNKGGYAVHQGTYASISNSIIWGNTPSQFYKGHYASLKDCAIAGSSFTDPQIIALDSMNSGLNDTTNYVRFAWPADSVGNVSTEEGLTHLRQAYWYILPGSACINRGDKSLYPEYAPGIDYFGYPRVIMDTIDIGYAEAKLDMSTDSAVVAGRKVILYGNVLFSIDLDLTRRGFDWGTGPGDLTNRLECSTTGLYPYSDTISSLPAPGLYYYRTWGMVGPLLYPGPVKSFIVCSQDTTREEAAICAGAEYIFPDSTVMDNITESMVHYSHLSTANGCDSIVATYIAVTTVDTTVTVDGATLTAAAGDSYQWVDCDNDFAAITGADEQSFTPTENGHYAVIVQVNNCADTSSCHAVSSVGIRDRDGDRVFEVYPNPVREDLMVFTEKGEFTGKIELWNVLGKKVMDMEVQGRNLVKIPVAGLVPGVYFLKIVMDRQTVVFRVLKE